MPTPGPTRGAPRHQLPINLRFHRNGALRRGVSDNVSATGMYVRSAHVPSAGELITFTRVPQGEEVRAEVIAEVRWGRSRPSLDEPEPGFGVHFTEIYALQTDRDALITLLDALGITHPASRLRVETRGEVTLAVCRFP